MIGRRLPATLLLPLGFAALIAVGGITTLFSWLAPLTTPIVSALAVAGLVANPPFRGRRVDPWPVAAAFGVYVLYLLPTILSGEAGFNGYIKLDDTSTWLAFTDHVLEYGHSVGPLAPSTHEATVQINLSTGYPLGAFIPLAVGSQLSFTDPAWLFQPYLALMAGLMALSFFQASELVVTDRRARAAVALVAAIPALLVGFAFWGGIKELVTAQVLAVLACVVTGIAARPESGSGPLAGLRSLVPGPVIAGSALIGVMGAGGFPWIFSFGLGLIVLMAWRSRESLKARDFSRSGPLPAYLVRIGALALGVLVIGVPTMFASGSFFSPSQGPLTNGVELGNLVTALNPFQYAGPWLNGDFRLAPQGTLATVFTIVLVIATILAFALGVWATVRRRAATLAMLTFGTGLGSLVIWLVGSPWVQGKALATGTASFLLMAMAGIAALITDPGQFDIRRLAGKVGNRVNLIPDSARVAGIVLLIVPLGIFASYALAFDDVWIAPRDQLAELEKIGEQFDGQGPALMTEYQTYGARHFLRDLDTEGSSELRRRLIPKLDGKSSDTGEWVDTDGFILDPARQGLLTYRTLVLRRSPQQSRPPAPYRLVYTGDYYEVWQRPEPFDSTTLVDRIPLGSGIDPGGVPDCAEVARLAESAGPGGRLVASTRVPVAAVSIRAVPDGWTLDSVAGTFTPVSSGSATGEVTLPESGAWRVFVGGSTRGTITVSVNGVEIGSVTSRLNNDGGYIEFGGVDLSAGTQQVEVAYRKGGPLHPGSKGSFPLSLGPIVFSYAGRADRLVEVQPSLYRELCDRRLDWVEAYSG